MLTSSIGSRVDQPVVRPTHCPFCHAKSVDTFAKSFTPSTSWRCRTCEKTWTLASLKPVPRW